MHSPRTSSLLGLTVCFAALSLTQTAAAQNTGQQIVRVSTVPELRQAAASAQPGTRIELAPGEYRGGVYLERLQGAAGKPIVIAGADPQRPPRFVGSGTAFQLSDPRFVELEDISVSGASDNGFNVDDGGRYSPEDRGLVFRRLHVANIGPSGNHDGM